MAKEESQDTEAQAQAEAQDEDEYKPEPEAQDEEPVKEEDTKDDEAPVETQEDDASAQASASKNSKVDVDKTSTTKNDDNAPNDVKDEPTNDASSKTPSKKRKASTTTTSTPSKAARRSTRSTTTSTSSSAATPTQIIRYLLSAPCSTFVRSPDEQSYSSANPDHLTYTTNPPLSPFAELMSALLLSRPISHTLGHRSIRTLLNEPWNYTTPEALLKPKHEPDKQPKDGEAARLASQGGEEGEGEGEATRVCYLALEEARTQHKAKSKFGHHSPRCK